MANFARKQEMKGNSQTVMDWCRERYYGVEDHKTNLVMMELAADATGRKELAGEVVRVSRRWQEERKLYFTTRGIPKLGASLMVVLVCFAHGVGTYL
jgi:hypothetical protein